jgi:hypothetical protein
MTKTEFHDVTRRLVDLSDVFDKRPPGEGSLRIFWETLEHLPVADVLLTLVDWARTRQKFPTPAEVFAIANERATDRRDERAASLANQERTEVAQFFRGKTPGGRQAVTLIRDALRAKLSAPSDPKAWARNILDRYVDGELVPFLSVEYACEVLGKSVEDVKALRTEGVAA